MYGQWVRRGNVLMQQIYRSGERFQFRGDVWHREPATIKKSAARTCFQKVLVQGEKCVDVKKTGSRCSPAKPLPPAPSLSLLSLLT